MASIGAGRSKSFFSLCFYPARFSICFPSPPGQAPDETNHFIRAYTIANGQILDQTVTIPLSIAGWGLPTGASEVGEASCQPIEGEALLECNLGSSLFYSPINYLPQAFGVWLAQRFTANLYVLNYAARLASLSVVLGMLCLCIRKIPVGKIRLRSLPSPPF